MATTRRDPLLEERLSHPDELAHVVRCWLGDGPITDSPARGTVRVLLDGRDRDR